LRVRGGIARTFGSLFVVLVFVLLLPGAVFLYDAVTHPLTADAGQVLIGSICVAFSLLLVFFLVRERHEPSLMRNTWMKLRARDGGQVFLFQNPAVMKFVPGDNKSESANRYFIFVGDAAALPGIAAQTKK
jgi:hypothetical protein